ncbi:hypothetical protein C0991_009907 [Blastosporella zonata]|nr:hypothetical protein C0991_009907 [Blastosporella zonata]
MAVATGFYKCFDTIPNSPSKAKPIIKSQVKTTPTHAPTTRQVRHIAFRERIAQKIRALPRIQVILHIELDVPFVQGLARPSRRAPWSS